jgi:acyl-CoA thioesterase I
MFKKFTLRFAGRLFFPGSRIHSSGCFLLLFFLLACGNPEKPAANPAAGDSVQAKPDSGVNRKDIVFFGNSLTAGYGLDISEAFPALIQSKIDSLKIPYKVINAGLSGETSAGGKTRVDWILHQRVDLFVLELGGNDGLRGIPPSDTYQNLQSIIDKVKAAYPKAQILLAGMQIPPSMGSRYAGQFRDIYPQLAKKNGLKLVPFLLEGVGGVPQLNQPDGIHPTAQGHILVADNVWKLLKPMLNQ